MRGRILLLFPAVSSSAAPARTAPTPSPTALPLDILCDAATGDVAQ